MDLAALADRIARRPGALPAAEKLRGLDGRWREAEQALLLRIANAPRRGDRLARAFLRIASLCGEDEAQGRAARLRGSQLALARRYEESLPEYEDAARRLAGMARDGARLGLAGSLLRLGRFDEAVRVCRKVRRAAAARGEAPLAAAAELNEAVAHHEGGRPGRAVPIYRRALASLSEAGHPAAAGAAQNLGNALVLLDRFDEAAALFAEAARRFEASGQARKSALCRYNRGAMLVATDALGEAESELLAAERELGGAGDPIGAALCRLDRGEALLRARLHPEARRTLSSARRALRRGAPPVERVRATLLLARAELLVGDPAAARALLRGVPECAEREELEGLARLASNRSGAALRALEKAAHDHGGPAARARTLTAASWAALETGDLARARVHARSAERLSRGLPVPGLRHAAAVAAFLVDDAAGRRVAADAALARALTALEEFRGRLGPDPMRAAVARGGDVWLARAVRHVLGGADGEARALDLVERFRARALLEMAAAAEREAPPEGRLADLRARVAVLERRLEGTALPGFLRAGSGAPTACVRALAAAERRLLAAARREAPPLAEPPFRLAPFLRTLPEGTLCVSLFADAQEGLAFVADRDRGLRVVGGLPSAAEVGRLAAELHFRVGRFALGAEVAARHARRLTHETDALLGALGAALRPLAEELGRARRLVVVPHGAWHAVPFAALPFRGRPLCAALPLALAPSLASLTPRMPAATGAPLVLSAADARAPTILEEGRAVASVLPGARLLEGDAARADAIPSDAAPACLHVAGHGRFRADAPALSGVRLADGWLRAVDFSRLPLAGALVVLSGCETGVVPASDGGEVEGLVRGVLASGAAELCVSLWRVDDVHTARLMARFHGLRSSGADAGAALATAQAEIAAAGLHPWYWAGFGLWSRRLGAPSPCIQGAARATPLRAAPEGSAAKEDDS